MPAVTMPAMYVDAAGALELRQLPVPQIRDGQVLLRTLVSAVCGSDLHRFRGSMSYGCDTDVFGHESVGEIVASRVDGWEPGERVLHLPLPDEGRVFAPFQVAHPSSLVALPDSLDARQAVFGQQLGTVVHARGLFWPSPTPPDSAYLAGAGPAGLMFVQLLKLLGCDQVFVAEPNSFRRSLATTFGAIDGADASEVALAIDASGSVEARRDCTSRLRRGGTLGCFGLPDDEPGELEVSLLDLLINELRVVGAKSAQSVPGIPAFHEAIRLLQDDLIQVASMTTHVVSLEELPATCQAAAFLTEDVGKVLVDFAAEESA